MKLKLTTSLVKALEPEPKIYKVWDTEIKGFFLRVNPGGHKSFCVFYRNQSGRGSDYKLGTFGGITVEQARKLAKEKLGEVAKGVDIQSQLNQARSTKRREQHNTLRYFIEASYGPWALNHQKGGTEYLRVLHRDFAFLLNKPMEQISPIAIKRWQNQQLKEGLKATSINRKANILKGALSRAVEYGHLDSSPLRGLKMLKTAGDGPVRYLSNEEETALLSALDAREAELRARRQSANEWRRERHYIELHPIHQQQYADYLKPMVILALNTGMRRGELFELEWQDIDFNNKVLFVRPENAKSGKGRYIPLNDKANDCLKIWREQAIFQSKSLVFASPQTGHRLDNINTAWQNLLKRAEIADFRFHDLRHHFASQLAMNGIELNTIRELLGHQSIDMTLRYAHLSMDHRAIAVASL